MADGVCSGAQHAAARGPSPTAAGVGGPRRLCRLSCSCVAALGARGEKAAAFNWRGILHRGVAPQSTISTTLSRRALPRVLRPARDALSLSKDARLPGLAATRDFPRGLVATGPGRGCPAWDSQPFSSRLPWRAPCSFRRLFLRRRLRKEKETGRRFRSSDRSV